jgi:hypothetical protein
MPARLRKPQSRSSMPVQSRHYGLACNFSPIEECPLNYRATPRLYPFTTALAFIRQFFLEAFRGVRGGRTIGSTDELGLHAVEDRLHVHDLHATILHLMGVDHSRLVYRVQGRPERSTLNEGTAYEEIAAG